MIEREIQREAIEETLLSYVLPPDLTTAIADDVQALYAPALAEIARLRQAIKDLDALVDQAVRARDAERAARRNAEADSAALKQALEERHICANCGGRGVYWTDIGGEAETEACECWIATDATLATDHPGAALLAELDILRELAEDLTRWRDAGGDIRDLRYVFETMDRYQATKDGTR